jgi:hypothetical protein
MSGTLAKIATNGPALRAPDAALPRSRLACMISSQSLQFAILEHEPEG